MLDLDDISFKMVKEYACMAMGFTSYWTGARVRYSSRTHSRAPLLSRASTMVVGISLSFTGIT
jgi:hypothetical protein